MRFCCETVSRCPPPLLEMTKHQWESATSSQSNQLTSIFLFKVVVAWLHFTSKSFTSLYVCVADCDRNESLLQLRCDLVLKHLKQEDGGMIDAIRRPLGVIHIQGNGLV